MRKLLTICGPTATGKTALGIRLAKRFAGEIISADSRQVYRGMDIGTGKDLPAKAKFQVSNSELKKLGLGYYLFDQIPVWLLDVVRPDQEFSVAQYVKLARLVIADLWRRGKLPILVGGTGFYLQAVIDGLGSLGIEPDWELRKKLSRWGVEQLREKLRRLDPARLQGMNESDRQNPRRLIRAIEIGLRKKKGKVDHQDHGLKLKRSEILLIGLKAPTQELYQRIDRRVKERVRQGIEKEIQKLLNAGYTWSSSVLGTTIGYQEWRPFFEGQASREEVIKRWQFAEHAYARRQMTWFKRDPRINWFEITQTGFEKEIVKKIKAWYDKNDDQKG